MVISNFIGDYYGRLQANASTSVWTTDGAGSSTAGHCTFDYNFCRSITCDNWSGENRANFNKRFIATDCYKAVLLS